MIHDGVIFPFSHNSSLFELQSSPSPLHVRVSPCVFACRVLQMKGFLLIFQFFSFFSPSFLYSYIPKRQRPDQKRKVRMRRLVFSKQSPAPAAPPPSSGTRCSVRSAFAPTRANCNTCNEEFFRCECHLHTCSETLVLAHISVRYAMMYT